MITLYNFFIEKIKKMAILNELPFASDDRNTATYPIAGRVVFGNAAAHSQFALPMARFQFYNSVGSLRSSTEAPILYMRMGGQFQTGLINTYNETTNIYGNPSGTQATDDALFALPTALKGGLTALYKQVAAAGAQGSGFLASAGTNGKAQYEIISRRVLNTFQQLIYQGPTFRRYTLPFTMKPTSLDEAKAMINIIKTFRIASAPRGGTPETIGIDDRSALRAKGDTDFIDTGLIDDVAEFLKNTPIAFGYPDMCSFEIIMVDAATEVSGTSTGLTQIFGSEFCVIENVQVDYGSQNKMLFFEKDSAGKYYPAEVTLTIGLRETTLPLGAQITQENNGPDSTGTTRTIF
jgi:hypothetical protein